MALGNFNALGGTSRDWRGMTSIGTDVYACAYLGAIYKQTAGSGSFNSYYATAKEWHGLTSSGTDIYACVYGEYIYKQTGGAGLFTAVTATFKYWMGMATLGTDIYAIEEFGDIYKQTGGTGAFNALGQTSRVWQAICVSGSDVYAVALGGYIYKQTGGTGDFLPYYSTALNWTGITALGNNFYATVINDNIYKQTNATGLFVSQAQVTVDWFGIHAVSTSVYAFEGTGDIYKAITATPTITSIDPSTLVQAGALLRITGTNLIGDITTVVTINGTDYSSYITSSSSTLITMIAPLISNGTYNLIVVADGTSSSPYSITYSTTTAASMAIRAPQLYQHYDNNDGTPLANGLVYTYISETTTPLYTTNYAGTVNANPVVLDAAGNAEIYLVPGSVYRFVIKTSAGVTITNGTQDGIYGLDSAATSAPVIVNSITDLKLLNAGVYSYATVLGYLAKTDNIAPRQYYWDSASTTTDDGGSVIKITATTTGRWKLVSGKEIDVKWFGATGDGTTNDYTAIFNAYTYLVAIGGGTLVFSYGAYNYTTALVFPATVNLKFLNGAYLKSSNTSIMTINKMDMEEVNKRFDSTMGAITFGTGIEYVRPEWYGALGDGSTNDSTAIQAAVTAGSIIEFLPKTYKVTTGITGILGKDIRGNGAILSPNANGITVLLSAANTDATVQTRISRLKITNGATKTSVIGLDCTNTGYVDLVDLEFDSLTTGVQIFGGNGVTLTNITAKSCTSAGIKLLGSGVDLNSCIVNGLTLDSNGCGLYCSATSYNINGLKINGLYLTANTVNGAYFYNVNGVSVSGLVLSGNGTGSSSISINSRTVVKSDLYIDAAKVSISDSYSSSTLNNSIQLITSSVLNLNNHTGYASTSNVEVLCDATSYVNQTGISTLTGVKNRLNSYGAIANVTTRGIVFGVGLTNQVIKQGIVVGTNPNQIALPQYPTITANAPATATHANLSGLTRSITTAASAGSAGTNSMSMTFGTASNEYQISSILFMCSTSQAFNVVWTDNSGSYSNTFTTSSGSAIWQRLVFVTAGKTSHALEIYTTNSATCTFFVKDAQFFDGKLDDVSSIYQSGSVYYTQFGDYASAAPTAGTWTKRQVVYNSDPDSAEYIGWVCTVAGTPGTWQTFGLIS